MKDAKRPECASCPWSLTLGKILGGGFHGLNMENMSTMLQGEKNVLMANESLAVQYSEQMT